MALRASSSRVAWVSGGVVVAALALSAIVVTACGSSSSSSSGGTDASSTSLTYTPAGCGYTVTPPDTRGFTDMSLDADDPAAPAPGSLRIGLGGATTYGGPGYADPTTTATFTWDTPTATKAAKVKIGTSADALSDVHAGYSFTTPDGTLYLHEVHVCGLKPDTTYYFQVGGGSAFSPTQQFTTMPKNGTITLGVSGDSRDSSDVFAMVQARMKDAGVRMQLFSGDLVLGGTTPALYQPYLQKIATGYWLPVGGNHENESSQYYGLFSMPGDGPYAETFYSFDVGSAHVTMIDDEHISTQVDSDEAKAQLAWIDADLTKADANRAAHPFEIVMHHRGELSTGQHSTESDVATARTTFMPLWDKHHVDLVLNGHDHDYERTKPVTGPASAPVVQTAPNTGTTYAVCAGAGATAYTPGTATVDYRAISVAFGKGTAYVGVYSLLTLEASKLTYKAYGLKSSGSTVADDDLVDTFELSR